MSKQLSLSTTIRILVIVSIVYIFTLELFNFDNIKKSLQSVERKNIEYLIKENANTLASLAYFHFDNELQDILHSIQSSNKSIISIRYIPKPITPLHNEMIFPLKYKNTTIGYLDIEYTYSLSQEFIEKYLPYFLIYLISLFFLAIFTTHYLSKKIDALKALSQKLEHIDIKKFDKLSPTETYKEIIIITQAINKLLREIKLTFKRLLESEKHLKEAQKIANMSSWEYNNETKNFYCSTQLYRILGINLKKSRITWQNFLEFIDPDDREKFLSLLQEQHNNQKQFEIVLKFHTQNIERYLKNVVKIRKKKNHIIYIGIAIDVTEEIKAKQQVEFLAYHDPLTSLPNRASFKEIVYNFAKIAKRNNQKFALIFLDLDNFKLINDSYGHDIGDRLLIDTANALKQSLRESDLIFRIGGDEFVILIPDIKNKDSLLPVIQKILHTVAKEYTYDNYTFTVTCSLGVALFPDDSDDIETLIRYADLAMYEAKREGKNQYRFFEFTMKQLLEHYRHTIHYLRCALEQENELVLYFQPKIDIVAKKVVGAEALIRWLHPQKGLLTPNHFVPVAEKSELIVKLDYYVLKKSIQYLARWKTHPILQHLSLSLNISAKTFNNPDLVSIIRHNLQKYDIDPKKLEIEITETLSMENVLHTIHIVQQLKNLGLKVALDDFGTGYSSLNYLKQLPFDTLKIDRSFIKDIDNDPDSLQITKIIIDIAKNFQKNLVAEGIENKNQEKILLDLGNRCAQGYLYSKPIDLDSFIEFVKTHNTTESLHKD